MSGIIKQPYRPNIIDKIFDSTLQNLPVQIKCTWVKTYIEPEYDRGLCIRSYDRTILKGSTKIGTASGNYFVDSKNITWVETNLVECDRSAIGWVRQSDVVINKKQVLATPPPGPGEVPAKSKGWMAWLTGAITLLSFLR